MNFLEMKTAIEVNHNSGDTTWQKNVFDALFERFSVIPVVEGTYKGSTPAEVQAERKLDDKKAAAIRNWQQYCEVRNPVRPAYGDKLGICTGPASGILLVDVDDAKAFAQFCNENGISTEFRTLTVQSSPGKFHLYFKYHTDGLHYGNRAAGQSGCGFDIRGIGGYVIAPGSIHPVTKEYYTISAPHDIAEAPEWVKEWALNRTLPPTPAGGGTAPRGLETLAPNLIARITTPVPVGSRSEASMSVMIALIKEGLSRDEVLDVYMNNPIGEKTREKGSAWFNREFDKANEHIAKQVTTGKNKSIDLAAELFSTMQEFQYFTNDGKYYCKCSTSKGIKFLGVDSQEFSGMIFSRQAVKTSSTGTTQQMKTALARLKYHASENAAPIEKVSRFGQMGDALLLNLGRASGECIRITKDCYSLVQQPDVLVLKGIDTLPIEQVDMQCQGLTACDAMLNMLGVTGHFDQHYMKMIMVSWLFDDIATPILFFIGNPGSGKTTLATALKGVFDPTEQGGAYLPETILETALVLSKSGIAYIDNFGSLNKKTQNALCLAFSKGYFSKKQNYTDTETVNIAMKCPVILSAVSVPSSLQNDLFSRMSLFTIEDKAKHKADSDIKNELEALYPKVRGELCWLASEILKIIDSFKSVGLKRHGDFDKLGQAYCSIEGNVNFYNTVIKHRILRDGLARVNGDPVLEAVVHFVREKKCIAMTMTELLNEVSKIVGQDVICGKTAASFSRELLDYSTLLNDIGISVIRGGKLDVGRIYLFATDEFFNENKLFDKLYLVNNPAQITNMHTAAHDAIVNGAENSNILMMNLHKS